MREFEKKRKIRKRIFSKLSALFLLIIFVFLAHSTYQVFLKYQESKSNLVRVNEQVVEIEDRHKALSAQVAALQTDEGIEGEIRQKFPVSKEGERVIMVVNDAPAPEQATTTLSFWEKLKYGILSVLHIN